jgi:excisionase family DNA binding protein
VTDFPDLDRDLPLLTVAAVAEYLSVDDTTVRRLVRRGEIRGRHVGDTVRVSPRDLRDYLCRAVIHVPETLQPQHAQQPAHAATSGARTSTSAATRTTRAAARSDAPGSACAPETPSRPTDGCAQKWTDEIEAMRARRRPRSRP